MISLISIAKEQGEISYTDLANKLNITEDALRGLLANTMKRTNKIERFAKDGRGWVRFLSDSSDLNHQINQ
jgi:predicted ArsR family transcriptional regulator